MISTCIETILAHYTIAEPNIIQFKFTGFIFRISTYLFLVKHIAKYNYLNLGCGKRYHPDWINLDRVSFDPNVKEANFIQGIPFPQNTFDVVYHSSVLEHFSKEDGEKFIFECFIVLNKGGVIRIALPNLEKSIRLYLQFFEESMNNPTKEKVLSKAGWIYRNKSSNSNG